MRRSTYNLLGVAAAFLVAGFLFFSGAPEVFAQINTDLSEFQEATQLGDGDIRIVIGNIVRVVLGFLGIIAAVLVLYGGFIWMTAGGNEERISTAKRILINAGVGLIIIMSAFAITQYVITQFQNAINGVDGSGSGSGGVGAGFKNSSALGTIIESHYPDRNEKNIPRNTPVIVTFKLPVDPASIMVAPDGKTTPLGTPQDGGEGKPVIYDKVKTSAFELYPESGADAEKPVEEKLVSDMNVTMTPDQKTFIFEPVDLLGSSLENTNYRARLTNEITNSNGKALFSGTTTDYDWDFEVSTIIDVTPPKVVSTFPKVDTTKTLPRNIGVTITFNEPVFPTAVSGKVTSGFNNIVVGEVEEGSLTPVLGTFRITNGYKTVEFQADDPSNFCGKNACGVDAFCLPSDAEIQVLAKAADLKNPGSGDPSAKYHTLVAPLGYHGVVDMVGNSLDGGGFEGQEQDGGAQGPADDNFFFDFLTSDKKDLEAPYVKTLAPNVLATEVGLEDNPTIEFSKPMMYSSFSNTRLYAKPASLGVGFSKKFTEAPITEGEDGFDFYDTRTSFVMHHGTPFADSGEYTPHMPSTVTDIAYNCFYPAQDTGSCSKANPAKPYCCNGSPSATACVVE